MIPVLTLLAATLQAPVPQDTALLRHLTLGSITIAYADVDSAAVRDLAAMLRSGRPAIERFFGDSFARPLTVRLYPDRASLTAHWAAAWGVPDLKAECWMVASGVANDLALLSPRVWPTAACDHDVKDTAATRRVVWHELVHVYHGQRNPHPTFDGMDDLGWFVEGVAVLASGQLDAEHKNAARDAIAAGRAPTKLAEAWSGRWRYGVSGSLVAYVDRTWGRRVVVAMLADTTQARLLSRLGVDEKTLLDRWQHQ